MILIILLIIIIIVYIYVRDFNRVPEGYENLPYVSGLPVFWALLQRKPYDEVEDLMSEISGGHGIYMTQVGLVRQVHFAGPEHIKDLLSASEDVAPKYEFKPGNVFFDFFGKSLPWANGDRWRTYRRLTNSAFQSALCPNIVGESIFDFFTYMEKHSNEPIEVYDIMQRATVDILGKLAFGYEFGYLKSEEAPQIIQVYKYIMNTVESPYRIMFPFPWVGKLPLECNRKFAEAIKELDTFIFDVIEKRKEELKRRKDNKNVYSGRVDLLTSLLEHMEKEGMYADAKQLRDETITLFAAGHDTSTMTMTTSLYYLAKYPEMQERARAEAINVFGDKPVLPTSEQLKKLKYLTAVIKESLRMFPPAPILSQRITTKEIKSGPYIIPKGTLCLPRVWQVQHNPRHWKNSKQFDPERFLSDETRHPSAWIPFSAGPRSCLGQTFAFMELRVSLAMILLKYNVSIPENSVHKDKVKFESIVLLRPDNLKLKFTERN